MALIRWKDVAEIAIDQYKRDQPPDFRQKASEFFKRIDSDGDGKVWLTELLASAEICETMGTDFVKNAFYGLDRDCKGHLGFKACLALYFICTYSTRKCSACHMRIIAGSAYTCLRCCSSVDQPMFQLCFPCYSSSRFEHEHGLDQIVHDYALLDLGHLLSRRLDPMIGGGAASQQTLKQCVTCGDFHEANAKGFMGAYHMSKMRNATSPEDYVCEWCFSYFCASCGNRFRDSTLRSEPGKWLQKFICAACHSNKGSTIVDNHHDAIIKKMRGELQHSELLEQCKTCAIKHRSGILVATTSPAGLPSSPSSPQQPWPHHAAPSLARRPFPR